MNVPKADAQFLAELGADPRLAGLDLADELRRCQLWASGGAIPTRKRFVNFLKKRYPKRFIQTKP